MIVPNRVNRFQLFPAEFPKKKEVRAPPFFGLIMIRLDFQLLFHKCHVGLQLSYVSL